MESSQHFSSMETDAIGEILNISLGSSATSVSELLGQPVTITTPEVKVISPDDFDFKTYEPAIGVEINYVSGLSGKNIMIMKETDVKVIVGLLLHTDFSDHEFVMDEMNIGAICEIMNQMMGASATALSQFLNRTINISPPNSFSIDSSDRFRKKYFGDENEIVCVYFHFMISNLVDSEFINVMPIRLAKELIANLGLDVSQSQEPANPGEKATDLPASAPLTEPAPDVPAPASEVPAAEAPPRAAGGDAGSQASAAPPQNYHVSQAAYPNFDKEVSKLTPSETKNLEVIMSVPLQIAVEIGRTRREIKDILGFSVGTIVELDKQAGSQVDVYVNGKAVSKSYIVKNGGRLLRGKNDGGVQQQ